VSEVIIRYRLRTGKVSGNNGLLGAFFDELQDRRPPGLAHDARVAEDGISFVHVVGSRMGPRAFADLDSYRRFRDTLAARCAVLPGLVEVGPAGRYRDAGK